MSYTRVNWVDSPSTATPIDAANLNVMDAGVAANATAIANLNTNAVQVGAHNATAFTLSAGSGVPATLAANEVYLQLS